jgi:predicted DNA-binding transcriptional regulator AlpA
MRLSRSLISSASFCPHCQKDTGFVPIQFACALTGLSRSTLYRWMDRGWIHWLEKPNARRVICQESLRFHAPKASEIMCFPQKSLLIVSQTVSKCPTVSHPAD